MEETIVAISTPRGEGAIGIIRMSGETAFEIIQDIFKPKSDKNIFDYEDKQLIYGNIIDGEESLDEVLVALMYGPKTYTKEDMVEINCHGGSVPLRRVLNLILDQGVRMAEPGEFTKRAFLNGRLDLAQAESVMDLISAKTPKGFDVAYNQLEGYLSQKINKLRDQLIELQANLEVSIDYPDADIEEMTYEEVAKTVGAVKKEVKKLIDGSETGKIIRDGLSTVIVGKPNVGKSSLLNALIKEQKAIVTNVPGTTRDIIEDYINVNGIPLKIIDTAGIRETENEIEKIGVERSKSFFNKADLIILVLNAAEPLSKEDKDIIKYSKDRRVLVVVNKTDLDTKMDFELLKDLIGDKKVIKTSVTEEEGLEEVENEIARMVYHGEIESLENDFVTNIRHINALKKAYKSLEDAYNGATSQMPYDFLEVDLKDSYNYLGEISGETIQDDIMEKIFSNFCLGK